MKKIILAAGAAAVALLLGSCNTAKKTQTAAGDTILLALSGTYTGTLPCADCPGIEARVDLKSDMTYTLQTRYIGRSDSVYASAGKFTWDAAAKTVTFDNPLLGKSLADGNALNVLVDGKKKEGANAENYILAKVDTALVERNWKLVELFGNPVTAAFGRNEAYIVFQIEGSRFSGSAGCNRVMGSYRTQAGGRIAFSQVASTQMMCIDMSVETKFIEVINTADSYAVRGDTLSLIRARMAPLARFVATAAVPAQ